MLTTMVTPVDFIGKLIEAIPGVNSAFSLVAFIVAAVTLGYLAFIYFGHGKSIDKGGLQQIAWGILALAALAMVLDATRPKVGPSPPPTTTLPRPDSATATPTAKPSPSAAPTARPSETPPLPPRPSKATRVYLIKAGEPEMEAKVEELRASLEGRGFKVTLGADYYQKYATKRDNRALWIRAGTNPGELAEVLTEVRRFMDWIVYAFANDSPMTDVEVSVNIPHAYNGGYVRSLGLRPIDDNGWRALTSGTLSDSGLRKVLARFGRRYQ